MRFAVIVYAADSFHHSVVPLNAVSVASASEGGLITAFPCLAKVRFAMGVCNADSFRLFASQKSTSLSEGGFV